jgi:hypothetical protein
MQRNDRKNWVVGRTVEEATERARILANGKSLNSGKMKMSSILGSHLDCGLSQIWDGQKRYSASYMAN